MRTYGEHGVKKIARGRFLQFPTNNVAPMAGIPVVEQVWKVLGTLFS